MKKIIGALSVLVLLIGCEKKDGTSDSAVPITLEFSKGDVKVVDFVTVEGKTLTIKLDSVNDYRCECEASTCFTDANAFFSVSLDGSIDTDSVHLVRKSCTGNFDFKIGYQSMDVDTVYGAKIGLVNLINYPVGSETGKAKIIIYKFRPWI